MSDKVSRDIFAGVASTLIASAIGTAFGAAYDWFPKNWDLVNSVGSVIWEVISYPVAVPASIISFVVVFAGVVVFRNWPRAQEANPKHAEIVPNDLLLAQSAKALKVLNSIEPRELSAIHNDVLRIFAERDGRGISAALLSCRLKKSKLVIDQALDDLKESGYIEYRHNPLGGSVYLLTAKGRDYVIKQGWVT